MLVALLVVVFQQLTPAHAASSAPAEAPPATASPNLFDSIFPHLAAAVAARQAPLSIRSAGLGEEAPAPESATEESALSPRSHRDSQPVFGTLRSSMFFPSCLWAARSCHLPVLGTAAVQKQGLRLPSHGVPCTLKRALLLSITGQAAAAASASTLTSCTSPAVLRTY